VCAIDLEKFFAKLHQVDHSERPTETGYAAVTMSNCCTRPAFAVGWPEGGSDVGDRVVFFLSTSGLLFFVLSMRSS